MGLPGNSLGSHVAMTLLGREVYLSFPFWAAALVQQPWTLFLVKGLW